MKKLNIDMTKAPAFIEKELGLALDLLAPRLPTEAAKFLPLFKQAITLVRQIIEKHGHADAEKLLDALSSSPLTKV